MSCWAPGLFQNESELELDSTQDEIQEGASSDLDLEEAYQHLERMKQRVLQMKSKIVRTLSTEAGTDQVPSDSDNVNLREIQLETSRGFQQIEAVKSRLKETSDELFNVGVRIEESVRCTEKLARQLDEVPKWMEEHKQQAGECLERYHELDASYCTDFDYGSAMRPLQLKLKNSYSAKVPLKCYKIECRGIARRLGRTRCMLNRTCELLMHSIRKIDEALRSPSTARELPFLMVLPEMLEAAEQLNELNDDADDATEPSRSRGCPNSPGIQGSPATIAFQIPTQ